MFSVWIVYTLIIMTLILTTVTPDYIIQACDRRVTYQVGDVVKDGRYAVELRDDNSTKSAVIQHEGVAAYTGLANLPRIEAFAQLQSIENEIIDSGLWLAEAISLQMRAGVSVLDSVNDTFLTMPNLNVAHAIIIAYWHRSSEGLTLPVVSVIDNLSRKSVFDQKDYTICPDDGPFTIFSKPINSEIRGEYLTQVLEMFKDKVCLKEVVGLMKDTIIAVSKVDETVGTTVNIVCIPRRHFEDAVKHGEWVLTDAPINAEKLGFGLIEGKLDGHFGRRTSPYFVIGQHIMGSITLGNGGKVVVKI